MLQEMLMAELGVYLVYIYIYDTHVYLLCS
jgi:hypothetical protein